MRDAAFLSEIKIVGVAIDCPYFRLVRICVVAAHLKVTHGLGSKGLWCPHPRDSGAYGSFAEFETVPHFRCPTNPPPLVSAA